MEIQLLSCATRRSYIYQTLRRPSDTRPHCTPLSNSRLESTHVSSNAVVLSSSILHLYVLLLCSQSFNQVVIHIWCTPSIGRPFSTRYVVLLKRCPDRTPLSKSRLKSMHVFCDAVAFSYDDRLLQFHSSLLRSLIVLTAVQPVGHSYNIHPIGRLSLATPSFRTRVRTTLL